ncbi:hypothetical protein [Pseudemcibacter aquimaris]|uniref:hypothetical protein n=1 Tax=Pseudemcibacter aquimaris TaxID=2857064 RepID=UPI002013539B|nr:hypothetical protein [Pseudemcibacter aquimaris]MCC3861813.1 hypothetical protein [Pseudemcibacter aquimaris]WDU58568.1 hypothetical protein KW060_15400 [Pseudemcibacter aquimaris]
MFNQNALKSSLLITAIATSFMSPVFAQETGVDVRSAIQERSEAETDPRSILFPSGLPGPYFPDDVEISRSAEERLNNVQSVSTQEIDGNIDVLPEVEIPDEQDDDPAAFGILSNGYSGLDKNIWQPSSIEKIDVLLKSLTLPSHSPVMDEIARKLLLSVTTAPTGVPLVDETENMMAVNDFMTEPQPFDEALLKDFINLRLNKLIERGNLEDLVMFVQALPEETLKNSIQNTEILLLGGDYLGACQMAADFQETRRRSGNSLAVSTFSSMQSGQGMSQDDVFWSKMTVFCRIMEEDQMGAQIALDMLAEQDNADFIFIDLANKLMEEPDMRLPFLSTGITSLDPLNYTMLSMLDQTIDAQLIENSSALIISAMVINPNVNQENRFQAAIKSNLSGGLSLETLKSIYDGQEFSEIEYQNAVRMAEFDDRPLADVLLYQAAERQMNDFERVAILDVIWNKAALNNDMSRKAALNAEALKSIVPSSRLTGYAHQITRGLLLAGEADRAYEWYEFVRRLAVRGDAEATTALINIWPLAVLSGDINEVPWSADILDLWWNGQMVLSPENREGRATLFYSVAEALGHSVGDAKWQELISNNSLEGTRPISLGVWREMVRAVGENKPAEAIILSLIAMGEDGPGKLDAAGVSTVIRLLRSFGLEQEARAVALEALVANDF